MDVYLIDLSTLDEKRSNSKLGNRYKWIFASLIVLITVLIITVGILSVYAFKSHSESFTTSTEPDNSELESFSTSTELDDSTTELFSTTTESDDSTTESFPTTTESDDSTTESFSTTTESDDSATESFSTTPESDDSTTESLSTTTQLDDSDSESFCYSTECIQSAASIKTSMDLNYNPCDDFYKFVCNNYENVNLGHAEPTGRYSNFQKITYRLNHMIEKLMEKPLTKEDPQPIQIVKKFYKSCSDDDRRLKLGLSVMDKYLNQSNLPKVPTIFTLSEKNWTNYSFNWVKTSVMMKKTFGIDLFVNVKFEEDTIKFLVKPEDPIIQPLIQEAVFNQYSDSSPLTESFKRTMVYLINEVLSSRRKTKHFNKVVEMVIDKMWNMTREAQKVNKKYDKPSNYTEMTLRDFQNLTDQNIINNGLLKKSDEDWENYVTMLYKELSGKSKNFSEVNITYSSAQLDYITNLHVTLSKIPDVMLEMYAWWRAIDLMILYTTQEMSLTLNHLLYSYTPPQSYCIELTIKHFNPIIAFGLITKDFIENTKLEVIEFVENLIEVFKERVGNLNWIDDEVEEVFIKKLDEIQVFVGAPDSITNETKIMSQYSRFHMKQTYHLYNMMQIIKNSVLHQFESAFSDEESNEESDDDGDVLSSYRNINEVNAQFELLTNSLRIFWAMLNPPFYNLGLPSLQYGALGTIIGHEIIHGFSKTAIVAFLVNPLNQSLVEKFINNSANQTWLVNFSDTFDEKSKCFVEEYNNFTVRAYDKDIKEDGTHTLEENRADNGGTQIAFYALKKYLESHPTDEYKLPGFEEYTSEQLFFLAQAHMWCEDEENDAEKLIDITSDVHSIFSFRINGVMKNTPEFAEAFDCPLGSNMNPERDRCDMWLIN